MSRRILNETYTPIVFATRKTFVSILCLLCALCGKSLAQDFRTVHPGVEYAHVDHKLGGDPVKINLLRLDLTKVRLDVHHALDKAIGTEKTSSIATRHGAVAAINAGFFRLDKSEFAGDSVGALRIDGVDYSEPYSDRVALVIINDSKRRGRDEDGTYIGHLPLGKKFLRLGKTDIPISGINRERKSDELIIYTPEFNPTTLTDSDGVEIVVKDRRVRTVRDASGSSLIPSDGYVISATGKAREELLKVARTGSKIIRLGSSTLPLTPDARAERLSPVVEAHAEDIVAGVPLLIRNGKIDITWEQEKAGRSFVEMRHPRTAVAKLKDGKFLMITVDGRQPGVSVGMNLQELADYILSLGALDAMNLDGGGSTTMFLDGSVVNKTSDKEGERKVSDAIVVTPRTNPRLRPR